MAKNNILTRSKLKKAHALFNEGKLNEACVLYEQIHISNKADTEVALELAVIYRKLGQFDKTDDVCMQVLSRYPHHALAHHIQGSAYQRMGKYESAINKYNTAININPQLVEAHYYLGNLYRETGQIELAAESLQRAVNLSPHFYEALNNLAASLIELHRPLEAKAVLNTAMAINPHSPQLLCNLSSYYMLENNYDEAFKCATKAHLADHTFPDALKMLAKIHSQNAEYDKSLYYYREASRYAHDIEITGGIGHLLERRSEFDESFALIKPLIDAGTTNPVILLTYSALSRKFGTERNAIDNIEKKLTEQYIDIQSRISLHSELGKQYDSLKEYDSAFHNYQQANLLERTFNKQVKTMVEDRDLGNTGTSDIAGWYAPYDKNFWSSLPRSGNSSNRPIFVVGMFRSGTTLCEQILCSHPDVHGAGELKDINKISFSIGSHQIHDKSPASLLNVTQQELSAAASRYLVTLLEHSTNAKYVVDKMPANFAHVGLISLLFPNAHIIHMVRDPRDVCLSMYFQRFGAQMIFSTDLEELADYHLSYQYFMKYWRDVSDAKILDVVYEDLTEKPEANIRRMLDFCGLEWNDACMSFHATRRDVNTPSYDQVRKPMYKKSVARWKHYEKHLQPLIIKLGTKGE